MRKVKGKVVVVGDASVGKTSLLQMYCSNGQDFIRDYIMTQGGQIQSKVVQLEQQEKDVELLFFDIAGQEIYKSIVTELVKDADLICLVFDCTNIESFKNTKSWYDLVKEQNNNKKLPGVLVSTKNDLKKLKIIEMAEGTEYAKKLNLTYFETSAARNMDIEQPFVNLAEKLI